MTFDLHTLDDLNQLGETFELKCKLAHGQNGQGEVPKDFWLTYSAVANSHGGVVLLGVREKNGVFTLSEGRTLDLHDSFEPFDHTVLVLHYSPTTPEKTPEKTPDAILSLLQKNPGMTIAQLAEALEKSSSAIERALHKLREQGHLRRVGPDKGGKWEVLP